MLEGSLNQGGLGDGVVCVGVAIVGVGFGGIGVVGQCSQVKEIGSFIFVVALIDTGMSCYCFSLVGVVGYGKGGGNGCESDILDIGGCWWDMARMVANQEADAMARNTWQLTKRALELMLLPWD